MGLLWACIAFLLDLSVAATTLVTTTHGPINGRSQALPNGKLVDSFLGIPFAAPPVGKNRFSPPQPLKPWNETLQAKALPKSCFQGASDEMRKNIWFVANPPKSEDCLYLNIWRPHTATQEKLATMIWIHSGGFISGSSNLPLYDGGILATEENVIVASMNYRTSLMGFSYFNSTEIPGNPGLRDQIQAIKWLRANVENFGGDKSKITLFGESAGAVSIGFHLINPDTYDLFRNGIMESGSPTSSVISSSREEALSLTLGMAKSVGCTSDNMVEVANCLRAKTPEELFQNYLRFPLFLDFLFTPVRNGVEVPLKPDLAAQNVPSDKRKSIIGGTIPGEVKYLEYAFFKNKTFSDDLFVSDDDLRYMLRNAFGLRDEKLQDVLLFQYNLDQPRTQTEMIEGAGNIITDTSIECPQFSFTEFWESDFNKVYYYSFTRQPSVHIQPNMPAWATHVHGEEVPFVFGVPLDSHKGYAKEDINLSKKVMSYWASFAKTGDPNHGKLKVWPEFKSNKCSTLLELDVSMSVKPYGKRKDCSFWKKIFPELLSLQDLEATKMPSYRNKQET